MSDKKPSPLISGPSRAVCPVCGTTSYSSAGIHPQCAVQQADEKRVARLKRAAVATKADKKTEKTSDTLQPWQRHCPKCRAVLHVRKKRCDCGHTFPIRKTSVTG